MRDHASVGEISFLDSRLCWSLVKLYRVCTLQYFNIIQARRIILSVEEILCILAEFVQVKDGHDNMRNIRRSVRGNALKLK